MNETTVTEVNSKGLCSKVVTATYDPWFSEDAGQQAYARGVCKVCPALASCALFALANDFEYGIFAAMDPPTRKELQDNIPGDVQVRLQSYHVTDIEQPVYKTASVEAKYIRRQQRAQYCYDRMRNMTDIPRGGRFFDVVVAVIDFPAGTGEQLGKRCGLSAATFNQYLRECFEYFNLDLSVL